MSTETEAQTIEVGDTVKATHTDGTTVQGVAEYAYDDNVEIRVPGSVGKVDLYEEDGWTFEVVSKGVKAPQVGDPWREGLPVGTTAKSIYGLFALRTREGWSTSDDTTVRHLGTENWTIVYIPESAND